MRLAAVLLVVAACGSSSKVLPAADCEATCRAAAGSDAAFCAPVCAATCDERCYDLLGRAGAEQQCGMVCASTCDDLAQTFDFNRELCEWIVENRPSAQYTPRALRKR